MGLTRGEALCLPIGELLDYIAVDQIKLDGYEVKKTHEEEQEEFFSMLNRR